MYVCRQTSAIIGLSPRYDLEGLTLPEVGYFVDKPGKQSIRWREPLQAVSNEKRAFQWKNSRFFGYPVGNVGVTGLLGIVRAATPRGFLWCKDLNRVFVKVVAKFLIAFIQVPNYDGAFFL